MTTRRTAATRSVADIELYGPKIAEARNKLRAAGYNVTRSNLNYSDFRLTRRGEDDTYTDVWGLLARADKITANK